MKNEEDRIRELTTAVANTVNSINHDGDYTPAMLMAVLSGLLAEAVCKWVPMEKRREYVDRILSNDLLEICTVPKPGPRPEELN